MRLPTVAQPPRGAAGRRPALWFLVGLVLPALLFAVASALYFGALLRELDVREWKRLPNVRAVPMAAEVGIVRYFAREAAADHAASGRRQRVLLVGDSQLFGYFHPAGSIASAHLARMLPGASVYNFARVGAAAGWFDATLRHAMEEGLRPDVLVINANPATQADVDTSQHEWAAGVPELAFLACGECSRAAARLLRDRWEGSYREPDLLDRNNVPPGDGTYQLAQLEKNYYPPRPLAALDDGVERVLAHARREGIRVVMFVSPHHYAPYNEPPRSFGWDTRPIVQNVMAVCRKFDNAVCLDLSTAFGREYFHDIVHLNPRGHKELAQLLAPHIRAQLQRPAPP